MPLRFAPDPSRADALSAEIHTRLGDSLGYIVEAAGSDLRLPADVWTVWLSRLRGAGRARPLIHAQFHALVGDIQAGDMARVRATAAAMLRLDPQAPPSLRIVPFDDAALGDKATALYARFADIEEANSLDLVQPDRGAIEAFHSALEDALQLIGRNDPALDGELRALTCEIVSVGQGTRRRLELGGLACFELWGALMIHAAVHTDALSVVERLAHESTHALLFALALDEPLLANSPDERYYSPLRDELRSVDGIYHATIVTARMARAMQRQADALRGDLRASARQRLAEHVRTFRESLAQLEAHARLTASGRALLDDTIAAMGEFASSAEVPERICRP